MTTKQRGLRILHLSDTHLFGDEALHYGVVDTAAALRRVLARAASLEAVDVVVASGDLSDDGSAESYRLLRAALDPWAAARGASVVYTMGNHDLRDEFESVIGERYGTVYVSGYRVVHLDSSVPRFGYGNVDAGQLQWLGHVLSEPNDNGTIVVVHHPPVPASTPLLAALELQNSKELLDVIANSAGNVRLILSGHYHHSLAAEVAGIPVVVAPGITNTTDVTAPLGTERAVVGAGFAVIDVPVAGAPRTTFVAASGPDDGTELYHLNAEAIAQIVDAAGPPR